MRQTPKSTYAILKRQQVHSANGQEQRNPTIADFWQMRQQFDVWYTDTIRLYIAALFAEGIL